MPQQNKITTTVRLKPQSMKWLKARSKKEGLTVNAFLQTIINQAMEAKQAERPADPAAESA